MATYTGTDVLWKGEPLKAIFHFGNNNDYTVYTDKQYDASGNIINKVSFRLSESNTAVNPMGICSSNSMSIEIFDKDDALSPANVDSYLYGLVVNGVEIEMFISFDSTTWTPYGKYYITNVSGNYSEGYHGFVNIQANDFVNTLGNFDTPEIQAYQGMYASELIGAVMEGVGLTSNDYYVDPRIDEQLTYGITVGNKVRDFINSICQLLLARCLIDRNGKVIFVPALDTYEDANEFDIGEDYTGTFVNQNTNNIDYNKLRVRYLISGGADDRDEIFNVNRPLSLGNNSINDIQFNRKALSIEQIKCYFRKGVSTADISNVSYSSFQNGIQLSINVTGEAIDSCNIIGIGIPISTTDAYYDLDIGNTSIIGGRTFEYNTQQIMDAAKAQSIATNLRQYLVAISRNINMNGCAISPKLYVGDKVVIDSDTMYDGTYKVTSMDISFGEDYSMNMTLIRVEEEAQ